VGDRYELVRRARGKETLVETGSLSRLRARQRELRASTRGGRVSGRNQNRYTVACEIKLADVAAQHRAEPAALSRSGSMPITMDGDD
jgi:hypothetical protein